MGSMTKRVKKNLLKKNPTAKLKDKDLITLKPGEKSKEIEVTPEQAAKKVMDSLIPVTNKVYDATLQPDGSFNFEANALEESGGSLAKMHVLAYDFGVKIIIDDTFYGPFKFDAGDWNLACKPGDKAEATGHIDIYTSKVSISVKPIDGNEVKKVAIQFDGHIDVSLEKEA